MKKYSGIFLAGLILLTTMSGCEVIEGVFKAGMWTMFIIIILVVLLIFWIVRRFRK